MGSKVYFMDGRSISPQTSLVAKAAAVFEAAGFDSLIKPGDTVAIKLHCGEWNNTAYLRPVYARMLVDRIKGLGGRPFVCDTTTLPYSQHPGRSTAMDLLITAERNGYNSATLGCPFICADGYYGTDDVRVDLPEGFILKEAYIATAIAAADVLIALTHFKGHPMGVIGGAVKNLGIGAQSKRGKFNVHMGGHPTYGLGSEAAAYMPQNYPGKSGDPNWQQVQDCCPFGLFEVTEDSVKWEREKCTGCMACYGVIFGRGIAFPAPGSGDASNAAIADACLAAVKAVHPGKVGFLNMAIDISWGCDCMDFADSPIMPHLGVFAGTDPVAVDKACLDKSIEAHGIHGSRAEEMGVLDSGTRKFEKCSTFTAGPIEETQLNTGVLNGLGSMEYELIDVPPKEMSEIAFAPDPRPAGIRLREMFSKHPPYPHERHEGHGFAREAKVDLERVNVYQKEAE